MKKEKISNLIHRTFEKFVKTIDRNRRDFYSLFFYASFLPLLFLFSYSLNYFYEGDVVATIIGGKLFFKGYELYKDFVENKGFLLFIFNSIIDMLIGFPLSRLFSLILVLISLTIINNFLKDIIGRKSVFVLFSLSLFLSVPHFNFLSLRAEFWGVVIFSLALYFLQKNKTIASFLLSIFPYFKITYVFLALPFLFYDNKLIKKYIFFSLLLFVIIFSVVDFYYFFHSNYTYTKEYLILINSKTYPLVDRVILSLLLFYLFKIFQERNLKMEFLKDMFFIGILAFRFSLFSHVPYDATLPIVIFLVVPYLLIKTNIFIVNLINLFKGEHRFFRIVIYSFLIFFSLAFLHTSFITSIKTGKLKSTCFDCFFYKDVLFLKNLDYLPLQTGSTLYYYALDKVPRSSYYGEQLKENTGKNYPSFFVFYLLDNSSKRYWNNYFYERISREKPLYLVSFLSIVDGKEETLLLEGIKIDDKNLSSLILSNYEIYYKGKSIVVWKRKSK